MWNDDGNLWGVNRSDDSMIGIQTKSSVRYKSSVSIFIEGGFYIDMSLQSIFRKLMRIMIKTLNANNITGNNLLTFCTFKDVCVYIIAHALLL